MPNNTGTLWLEEIPVIVIHPDAQSVIIFAMTANAFAEDVQASREAGMDGHIVKPVDMKLLYHLFTSALKKKKS